jgi:hypothetical protein
MTALMMIAILLIYQHVVSGPDGTKAHVRNIGGTMNETIQSIDP